MKFGGEGPPRAFFGIIRGSAPRPQQISRVGMVIRAISDSPSHEENYGLAILQNSFRGFSKGGAILRVDRFSFPRGAIDDRVPPMGDRLLCEVFPEEKSSDAAPPRCFAVGRLYLFAFLLALLF